MHLPWYSLTKQLSESALHSATGKEEWKKQPAEDPGQSVSWVSVQNKRQLSWISSQAACWVVVLRLGKFPPRIEIPSRSDVMLIYLPTCTQQGLQSPGASTLSGYPVLHGRSSISSSGFKSILKTNTVTYQWTKLILLLFQEHQSKHECFKRATKWECHQESLTWKNESRGMCTEGCPTTDLSAWRQDPGSKWHRRMRKEWKMITTVKNDMV